MSSFLVQLLEYYQISLDDLKRRTSLRSFNYLTKPNDERFNLVINRLKRAINNKEKIVIYGDYDVDGLTSTTILKSTFDKLKAQSGFYIPSRYMNGYGLNKEMIDQFKKKNYQLIVTIDNGISCFDEVKYAKSLGFDVVIIDHHDLPDKLPETDYIFQQKLSNFTQYNCSAASLALFVSEKLLNTFDDYYLTLAGMAVFSDVMPLTGNNLVLANIMIDNLNKYRYPNLTYLINSMNQVPLNSTDKITYHDVNYNLISSLNSVGRISQSAKDTNALCFYLLNPFDYKRINRVYPLIINFNNEKKQLVKNYSIDEKYTLETSSVKIFISKSLIGISGLICNQLMNKYHLPIVIFAEEKEQLIGSIRAPDPYDLTLLKKYQNKFITFGGHKKACGLTIYKKDYYQIATLLATEFSSQSLNNKVSEKTINITLDDLNSTNYSIYKSFEPFGEGFNEPEFSLTTDKENLTLSNKGVLKAKNNDAEVVYFNAEENLLSKEFDSITFKGKLGINKFNNKITYQLKATKFVLN